MDLVAIVVLTAIIAPLLTFADVPEVARVPLGLVFLIFFPGYALIAAIFPRRTPPEAIERLALSALTSLAVVPLIGITLNYSPWGLRAGSILAFVGLFTALVSGLGLLHRRSVPADERLDFGPSALADWASQNLRQFAHIAAAALGVLAAIGIVLIAVPSAGQQGTSEQFTEFYLLDADGTAEGYPTVLTVGEPATVTFGIVNQEDREVEYTATLLINESPFAEYRSIRLDAGQRLERPVTFRLREGGEGQAVHFVLYKDGEAAPYRSLHLRLDGLALPDDGVPVSVEARPASDNPEPATATPFEVLPESAPPATPPPPETTDAPPSVHIVSSGETLYRIADDYGLTLDALLAVNDLADPNLIHPSERINVPPSADSTGNQ